MHDARARRDAGPIREDFTIDQRWSDYRADEHARWDQMAARMARALRGRACETFLNAAETLELSDGGIPDFERLSDRLEPLTGWRERLLSSFCFFHSSDRKCSGFSLAVLAPSCTSNIS